MSSVLASLVVCIAASKDLQMRCCCSSPRLPTGLTKTVQQHLRHMYIRTAGGAMSALFSDALQQPVHATLVSAKCVRIEVA